MNPEVALGVPPWLLGWLDWIHAHPVEAMIALALASAVEGLFLIGLFIPGSLLMFAAGAIAVAGEFPLWPIMLTAGLGAWLGDAASYYLGWRYRAELPSIARRLRMPTAIDRGQRFFARHGGKSIFLGRFVGPLRPLVPAIAGASSMPPLQFLAIDLVAALLWAPAYALPGVLLGATLSLAAEVTSRFALMLGLILGLVWLLWWLVTHAVRLVQNHAEPWLLRTMDWSHKHRRLGHLGPALADPDQPETPILAISLFALAAAGWFLGHLWWQWPGTLLPPAIDDAVYDGLAIVLTPAALPFAHHLDALGSGQLNLLLGVTVLVWLSILRQPRAAAHWMASLVGGALLGLCIPGDGIAIGPGAILDSTAMTTLSLCLWFSLAGLLSTRQRVGLRVSIYVGTGLLCGFMLLAKLAMGQISYSQIVLALVLSLTWISLLTLGFRRHLRGTKKARPGLTLALVLSVSVAALNFGPLSPLSSGEIMWDDAERSPGRINMLWHADAEAISADLIAHGWKAQSQPKKSDYLNWLSPTATEESLPPAPQWLAGRRAELHFRRQVEGQPTLILRLWQDPQQGWLGQVGQLRIRHWAGLLHVPTTQRNDLALAQTVADIGAGWQISRSPRKTTLYVFSVPTR